MLTKDTVERSLEIIHEHLDIIATCAEDLDKVFTIALPPRYGIAYIIEDPYEDFWDSSWESSQC